MRKIIFLAIVLLSIASCKQEYPIPPLAPDSSIPTLSWPFASFASTSKFIPFGDTLPGGALNKGYEVYLSDTLQPFVSVDSGYVVGIAPSGNGSNAITVIYRKNSAYQMVYSGVRNVQVRVNDTLAPSTVLGKVGNSGIIDFKLLVNGNMAVCPQSYGGSAFNDGIATAIRESNHANPNDSITSPCLLQTLPD